MKNDVVAFALLLGLTFVTVGCGDSEDENPWGGTTTVREITADDDVVPLGDGTVFRIDFAFDEEDVFNDQGEVHLVVKIPNELAYRTGSAEVDGYTSRDDDGVDPTIVRCRNDSYLSFNLTRYNLDDAEPPSADADAQLKLTLNGVRLGANVVVEAAADESDVAFGCKVTFVPDEQEVVSVR